MNPKSPGRRSSLDSREERKTAKKKMNPKSPGRRSSCPSREESRAESGRCEETNGGKDGKGGGNNPVFRKNELKK